jgi:hypothetical protein
LKVSRFAPRTNVNEAPGTGNVDDSIAGKKSVLSRLVRAPAICGRVGTRENAENALLHISATLFWLINK